MFAVTALILLSILLYHFAMSTIDLVLSDYIIWVTTILIILPTALELYVFKFEYSVTTTLSLDVLGLTYAVVGRSISLAHSYLEYGSLKLGYGVASMDMLTYVLATHIVGGSLALVAILVHMRNKRPIDLWEILPEKLREIRKSIT